MRFISKILVFGFLFCIVLMLGFLFYNSSSASDIVVSDQIAGFINNMGEYNLDTLKEGTNQVIDFVKGLFVK